MNNNSEMDNHISFEERIYGLINQAGFILAFLSITFGPISEEQNEYPSFIFAFALSFAYILTTYLTLLLSGLERDSDLALSLHSLSWCWLLYWLQFEGLILPAFIGHLLFLGTFGRIIWAIKLYNKKRYNENT